jgi:hypothetical protein
LNNNQQNEHHAEDPKIFIVPFKHLYAFQMI